MALVFRNIYLALANDSSSSDINQVLSLFNKLNKSKGAGLDEISSWLILDCADLIAPQISIIFNSILARMVYFLTIGSLQGILLYLSKAK